MSSIGVSRERDRAAHYRRDLVDRLLQVRTIRSPAVEAAFRAVPRHLFLPGASLETAYADRPVAVKYLDGTPISAASQPTMVAIMLERLTVRPGHRVLEIGAGTGYNAALIAHMVGERGSVVTVDIDRDLVDSAREHLDAAGYPHVRVACDDGFQGYIAGAPYDRIVLTASAADIAPAWRAQLAPGGRLLLPLLIAGGLQKVVVFEPDGDHLRGTSVDDCRFMPLRGAAPGEGSEMPLDPDETILFRHDGPNAPEPATVLALLTGDAASPDEPPWQQFPALMRLTAREVFFDLLPWLDLHAPGFCTFRASGSARRDLVPPLLAGPPSDSPWHLSSGVIVPGSLCLLYCPPPRTLTMEAGDTAPFDLHLRVYGTLAAVYPVLDAIASWQQSGRPSTERLRIRAYPRDLRAAPGAGESSVDRRHSRLLFDWPG